MARRLTIAKWIEDQCAKMIDGHTGKPISWRQASIQAGFSPGAFHNWIRERTHPDPESCDKLAAFFSVPPDHNINPDYLLFLAGHRREEAPEYLEPTSISPPPLTDEQADAIIRAILGDDLYEALSKMIKTPGGREFLTARINEMLGKME